jgi:hypothetical protein
MSTRRLHAVAGVLVILVGAPGCALLHDYRQTTILVRDGETKDPIAGAQVDVKYSIMFNLFGPWDECGHTGLEGTARLPVAAGEIRPCLRVSAGGYLDGQTVIPDEDLPARGSWWSRPPAKPPVIVDLYRGPAPTVELVFPNKFRGLVVVEFQPGVEDGRPGERSFSVRVPQSGLVEVRGPPVLQATHGDFGFQFAARFEDGSTLGNQFRWLTVTGDRWFYAVGSDADVAAARNIIDKRLGPNISSHDHESVERWIKERRAQTPASSRGPG